MMRYRLIFARHDDFSAHDFHLTASIFYYASRLRIRHFHNDADEEAAGAEYMLYEVPMPVI